jgi:hypothetical protein
MLVVKVYELSPQATEEVMGEYRLVSGEIVIFPPDCYPLQTLLEDFPIEPTPEEWLRTLCQKLCGTYVYAGQAKEV